MRQFGMTDTDKAEYIMDDQREGERLSTKVDTDQWVNEYLAPLVDDRRSLQIFEMGCGPGHLAAAAARHFPGAGITGADGSATRISAARNRPDERGQLTFEVANATDLPFDDEVFDLVYCRFMLEYVDEAQSAVNELVRVCKPGGRVLLQDLDGQLIWHYPEEPEFIDQISRVLHSLKTTGFDPFVGRKLYSFMRKAGIRQTDVRAEAYHLYAGAIDPENERLWQLKLDIAKPQISAAFDGDQSTAADLVDRFMEWLRNEETLTYSVAFTVVGTKEGN